MPTRIICAAIYKVDWFALGDGSVSLERPYLSHILFSPSHKQSDSIEASYFLLLRSWSLFVDGRKYQMTPAYVCNDDTAILPTVTALQVVGRYHSYIH